MNLKPELDLAEDESLTRKDVREKVKIVRYEYGLSKEEAAKLQQYLYNSGTVTEFVERLEEMLMEFTVAKGRPSRQEFEDVNTQTFSDIQA